MEINREKYDKQEKNTTTYWQKKGFVMLPHGILFDDSLCSSDLMVYWVLMVHQFQGKKYCTPSQSLISKESKVCRRTVISSLKRLELSKWIEVESKAGKVSKYYVKIK